MNDQNTIFGWLDHLRTLFPVHHLVLIGAGAGTGPWVRYLQAGNYEKVTLVEADKDRFSHLQCVTSRQHGWRLGQQLIASENGITLFHQASLPSESGIVNPELLRGLWANLRTSGQQSLQAITLERLLADCPLPANWVMLDCLPATAILESAASFFEGIDVIAARVLLEDSAVCGGKATLVSLRELLEARQFRLLAVESSRNPGLGHALFVKDSASVLLQARTRFTESAEEVARLKTEIAGLKYRAKLQDGEVAAIEAQLESLLPDASI
jgi:hypothetical protein